MIGKVIDYQAKQITYNIYSYYKKRKLDKRTSEHKEDINLIDIVSEVTQLSKSTVTRIIREGNALKAEEGTAVFKPQDKKKHIRKKRILIDEITEGIIRRKVIQFYTVKNEVPSVRRLNKLLKKENILKCSDEYLRQLLHKLGFTDAETDSGGMLRERADIVSQRLSYLQSIKGFREQGKDIFFLNETLRWAKHNDSVCNIPKDMPKLLVIHMSGETGFLDGALIMMNSDNKEQDTSLETFANHDWVKNTVLQNIPPGSIFVMNFPFCETPESIVHDEQPTLASTRASIESWLNKHNIPFQDTASKSDLLQLIKTQEAKIKYSITKVIAENNHEVLYLPKNHSDLNPAFIVWEEIKEYAIKTPPKQLFLNYSEENWENKFEHVRQNEAEYFAHDIKAEDCEHIMQLKQEKEDEDDLELKSESDDDGIDYDF